jgi:hypothetical protein
MKRMDSTQAATRLVKVLDVEAVKDASGMPLSSAQCGPAAAPRALRTDRGGLYIQDSLGGSPSFSLYWWDSWYQANGAVLQVELLDEEED